MTNILTSITELTLGMSAVIVLLLVLLMWKGKTLRAKSRYIIWTLVILRLAVPFSAGLIPSLFTLPSVPVTEVTIPSVQNNREENISADTAPQYSVVLPTPDTENVLQQSPAVTDSIPSAPVIPDEGDTLQGNNSVIPDTPEEENPSIGNVEVTPDTKAPTENSVQIPSADQAAPDKADVKIDVVALLFAVWLTGAGTYAAVSIISYSVYTRRVLKTSTPAESETMAIYESLCGKMNVKNRPRLLISRATDSPAAFGIFRKYIVLPELPLSLVSLELTLSHELTHVKRRDLALKLVAMAARSFHWFNPLVHLAARRCESECELSCDEAVLAGRGDEARTEYGETLVDILKFCRKRRGSLTTHFSPDKKAVKARLVGILTGSGKKHGIVLVALCLALCIVAGTVIGCSFGTGGGTKPATDTDTEETSGAESESTPYTESTPGTESAPDTDPVPEEVKSALTVLPGSSENVSLYENVIFYDAYTGDHIMCVLLVAERDVENFSVTRLTWSEELLVESEEIIHTIGGIKAGDAVMLNADPVEIVGYTGISYEVDGKLRRAFPATSGLDGSPTLVDIDEYLSPYLGVDTTNSITLNISKYTYTWVDNGTDGGTYSIPERDGECVLMYTPNPDYKVNAHAIKIEGEVYAEELAIKVTQGTSGIRRLRETEKLTIFGGDSVTRTVTKFQTYIPDEMLAELKKDGQYEHIEYLQRDYVCLINFGTLGEYLVLEISPNDINRVLMDNESAAVDSIMRSVLLTHRSDDVSGKENEDNVPETPSAEKLVVPDESFKGEWNHNTGRYYDDSITLTVIQRDKIQFHVNSLNYSATAVLIDGMWLFGDDVYPVYKQDPNIGGMLEFTKDSVTVRYGEFGKLSDTYSHMNAVKYTRTFTHHKTNLSRSYSDRIYSCDVTEMPRRVLGHYTVEFNDWNSDYVLKTTVTVCNGGCESYDPFLYNGEVFRAEYGTEDGWEYPVKVYTRKWEGIDPDADPSAYCFARRFAHYIFDMGNGMHYELEFNAASYDTTPLENEQEILDALAKSARLEYNIPGHMSKPVGNVTVDVRKNTYVWRNDGIYAESYDLSYDLYPNIETSNVTYTTNPDYKTELFMTKKVEGKFDSAELVRRSISLHESPTDFKVIENITKPAGYQGTHSVTVLQSVIPSEMHRDLESRSESYTIEHLQRRYYYVINYGTEGEYLILSIVPTDIDIVPAENDKAAADAIARSAYVTE